MTTFTGDDSSPEFIEANNRLRWYCIGFVALTVNGNTQIGQAAGSGTLVRIGEHKGILTAAHVARPLLGGGSEVGLVRFPERPQLQRLIFRAEHTRVVHIGEPPFGPAGPDISFIALPPDITASLDATSTFFNLSKRVAFADGIDAPPDSFVDCLAGVIDERTKPIKVPDAVSGSLVPFFEASFEPGKSRTTLSETGLDLMEFTPQVDEGYVPPRTYAGTSGAALWRVQFERNEHGERKVAREMVCGLAFYESDATEGARTIVCHGPASIYRNLHDKVLKELG